MDAFHPVTGPARQSIELKAQYDSNAGGTNHDVCTCHCTLLKRYYVLVPAGCDDAHWQQTATLQSVLRYKQRTPRARLWALVKLVPVKSMPIAPDTVCFSTCVQEHTATHPSTLQSCNITIHTLFVVGGLRPIFTQIVP
jgi:hypothetical protein